jgi:bifunctional non-homologous end joining protein LigD
MPICSPQLATLQDEAPEGDQWLHELKFDGYRLLCHLSGSTFAFDSQ